jgi:hypothetical protein
VPRKFKCQICSHPSRAGIDAGLIGGASFGQIAQRFGCEKTAVFRHKQHVEATLATTDEFDALDASSVLRYVAREAARLGRLAEQAEDYGTALKATLSLRDGLQWLKIVPPAIPEDLSPQEALERARTLVEVLEAKVG